MVIVTLFFAKASMSTSTWNLWLLVLVVLTFLVNPCAYFVTSLKFLPTAFFTYQLILSQVLQTDYILSFWSPWVFFWVRHRCRLLNQFSVSDCPWRLSQTLTFVALKVLGTLQKSKTLPSKGNLLGVFHCFFFWELPQSVQVNFLIHFGLSERSLRCFLLGCD